MIIGNEDFARFAWDKYKIYKKGREVIRSGFGLCGAYHDYSEGMKRPATAFETILEHQAATAFLAVLLLKIFPDLLPSRMHQQLIELMVMHDVVEVESGDLADDGHLDKSQKTANEQRFMRAFADGFDNCLPESFALLEQINGLPMDVIGMDETFGQLAFIIDKMEAVLQLAFFELNGIRPNLTYKLEHFGSITDRDRFYMELTGSDTCLDVWMAHFCDFAKSYMDFGIAKYITVEAYREARGCEPKWLDKILADPMTRCWPANRT